MRDNTVCMWGDQIRGWEGFSEELTLSWQIRVSQAESGEKSVPGIGQSVWEGAGKERIWHDPGTKCKGCGSHVRGASLFSHGYWGSQSVSLVCFWPTLHRGHFTFHSSPCIQRRPRPLAHTRHSSVWAERFPEMLWGAPRGPTPLPQQDSSWRT